MEQKSLTQQGGVKAVLIKRMTSACPTHQVKEFNLKRGLVGKEAPELGFPHSNLVFFTYRAKLKAK